jgi:acyl-CoA synthetase (AMP-forming)/AMP-acid ligase II
VKSPRPIKVGLVSLGCAKNLVDSEVMLGSLAREGMELAARAEDADVVIINTCGFIEAAKQESIDAILSANRLRETGKCRALIMAARHKSSDYVAMLKSLAPEIETSPATQPLRTARFPSLERVVLIGDGARPAGMLSFRELTSLAGPAHRNRLPGLGAALDPDDPINIQFTSGTTGLPKGATLSSRNIVNNARYSAKAMRLGERDRLGAGTGFLMKPFSAAALLAEVRALLAAGRA